ncbi:uncharacterized protein FPRO_08734 [Fusarium proliferatum ET1]|uniref:Protein kinase domain-containing protein n=1 Tax=Fusarium proliferatum (strain ET1) TaxID=1227346 RepID=A0A1L7W3Z3_FUSPR|nr:uncharacterized protein FPRO_08734 [Fusarium proliferatum ET1]CZR47360.1 uncharacterized protein FPRO_08734 [Fusarium proliferatum ET1]
MAAFRVELSLTSWEKDMIRDTNDVFSEELSLVSPHALSPVSKDWIRNNWSWATYVQLKIQESILDLDDEEKSIHQMNPVRTWEILKNKLSSRTPPNTLLDHYSCHSRLRQLLDANSDLPSLISQPGFRDILPDYIHFANEDEGDWQAVWNFSTFIKDNHPRLHGLHISIPDLRNLEQLCSRISPLEDDVEVGDTSETESCRNIEAGNQSVLCEYPAFEIYFMVRTVASYCRQSQVELPKELAQLHGDSNSILNDLEFIPMSELIIDGDLAQNPVTSWRPSKACSWDHHLFTEEEVLKFCCEANFEFPGYRGKNGIVFEATELSESDLCKTREDLYVAWNDCGFTFDPATKRTYLLQTRPGIIFRELQKRFSLDAARKYFRSVIDQQRLNRHETFESVLDDMQLQNSKIQAYGGLVDLIPFREISLTGETDDTGHSGAIPFGSWHVPQGARLHRVDSEVIPVALKLIWRPGDPNLELLKREQLASSITTFTDSPIASIRLDGLTINPESREIFLVFERARSVPLFLEAALVNTGTDWDLISELLRDAADSLDVIHKRGYLHRDIHMGNVLIHDVPCPNDPFDSSYTELVIIDLGQGQDLSNSAWVTSNYYGNHDYWAPEVIKGRQYSEKSDVFAVGHLMIEILSIRCRKAKNEKVPKVLWDLIATCYRKDPDQRPKAHELATQAQQLRDEFFVVPESRSTAMRGEVVLNGPYVDFPLAFDEWRQSLNENDKDELGDLVPNF